MKGPAPSLFQPGAVDCIRIAVPFVQRPRGFSHIRFAQSGESGGGGTPYLSVGKPSRLALEFGHSENYLGRGVRQDALPSGAAAPLRSKPGRLAYSK
jgi:hypothetical protein